MLRLVPRVPNPVTAHRLQPSAAYCLSPTIDRPHLCQFENSISDDLHRPPPTYLPSANSRSRTLASSNMPLTEALYGKKAAALYQQAGAFQAEARTFQLKAKDAYFQANNWAGYDDMRRARQYAPSSVTTVTISCALCEHAMQPIQTLTP